MLFLLFLLAPLANPEREAVSVVSSYLASGPAAVYERLTPDAPLRSLPREEALQEIAVRFGPREGATWTLRKAAEGVAFHVRWPSGYEDGLLFRMRGSALHSITTMAEPNVGRASARPSRRAEARPTLLALSVVCILGAIFIRKLRLVLVAAGAALAVVAVLPLLRRAESPGLEFTELRALLRTRNALARGEAFQVPEHPVARLWAGMPADNGSPLAHLVRARLALADGKDAREHFERVVPVRDNVLLEADLFERMRKMGSRDAEAYYRDSTFESFRTAWQLEPKPREELVRQHATLLDDLRVKTLVSFHSASEPVVRSRALASQPMAWPNGAKAFVCGERLRVEIGNAAVVVPNGAALAPKDAQVVAATYDEQRRDALALAEAKELLEKKGIPSRPVLTRAVAALVRHNRWSDVLKLTDEDVPPELLHVRIRALLRAQRVEDARKLAETQQTDDPLTRIAIAEAMSNAGQWATAETLFRSISAEPQLVQIRLRQLELRRALATNAQTIATPHFDIRHDATINPAIASRIGDLLEAELARLQLRLPKTELRRVAVNVLRWEDFSGGITLSDHILGLYDGEILFPFAAVEQFKPAVVSVITHELAHAILAQATGDNAPRWFQEGVATRMELLPRQENAFRDTPSELVLPVTLLDAVMEKNADPNAYVVAQTFIRFLEDRYGANAIATLAGEFANGTNSDDALTKLTGKSLEALNADFRQWGFHHNGDFVNDEPWPYRDLYSPGVDPRIREGFKFGVRQP
ncbi:MAG TPA: basic secretory protein-like protein [Thermoanaerobaculia bacterium]|nr:basic secretory protein-like protein [Thermoanaerobaculia bacterium]